MLCKCGAVFTVERKIMAAVDNREQSCQDCSIDEIESLRAQLAEAQKQTSRPRCETCGSYLILGGCSRCGAPICCPCCCKIDLLERHLSDAVAAIKAVRDHEHCDARLADVADLLPGYRATMTDEQLTILLMGIAAGHRCAASCFDEYWEKWHKEGK